MLRPEGAGFKSEQGLSFFIAALENYVRLKLRVIFDKERCVVVIQNILISAELVSGVGCIITATRTNFIPAPIFRY